MSISVIILTKKGDKHLTKCIESVRHFDEIILLVDGEKGLIDLPKLPNLTVYYKKINGDFASHRNFIKEKAKNEYVFYVDSDEIVSGELISEIKKYVNGSYDGYYIKREDFFLGHKMKYGDLGNVWIMRIGKKNKGKWVGNVHEIWKITGKTTYLKKPLIHKSHGSLSEFIDKLNYYSTLRSQELKDNDVSSTLISIILFPLGKFIYLYILRSGFLDGMHGFVHAVFMSMYSFLVRAKLLQKS